MPRWSAFLVAIVLLSCATYREDLNRGQRLFEATEYERSLAIWRMLEPDYVALGAGDRARYAYLRGMTDYRLGFKDDARHWLAIARAIDERHPGGLQQQWPQRLTETLGELNREAYGLPPHDASVQDAIVE